MLADNNHTRLRALFARAGRQVGPRRLWTLAVTLQLLEEHLAERRRQLARARAERGATR